MLVSHRFTPWAIPAVDIPLILGVETSLLQVIQIITGFPIFIYGGILVQRTTQINHTVQNRETRKPQKLLTHDVYAVRRHPMYAGFICLQAGFWIAACSLIGYVVGGIIILIVTMNSRWEESAELEKLFPKEYARYKQSVTCKIYTPRLTAYLLLIFVFAIISAGIILKSSAI